jgi:hypothetical protein
LFHQEPITTELNATNVKLITDYLNQTNATAERRNASYLSTKTNGNLSENLIRKTTSSSSLSSSGPQYAEIYGTGVGGGVKNANPYATTGLFLNEPPPGHNQQQQHHHHQTHQVLTTYDYENNKICSSNNNCTSGGMYASDAAAAAAIKTLNNNTTSNNIIFGFTNKSGQLSLLNSINLEDNQKIAKYLLSQSQTNTPKVVIKNLQNKVKSVESQNGHGVSCYPPVNCTQGYYHDLFKQPPPHGNNENCVLNRVLIGGPNSPSTVKNLILNSSSQLPVTEQHRGDYCTTCANNNGTGSSKTTNEKNPSSSKIRNFYDSFLNKNNLFPKNAKLVHANQINQSSSSSSQMPSLPSAPPPSLNTALFAKQIEQQIELQMQHQHHLHQQKYLSDRYDTRSPVQYSSPWNSNGIACDASSSVSQKKLNMTLVNQMILNQASSSKSNSNSLVSNITGNSTLSRGGGGFIANNNMCTHNSSMENPADLASSTFTSQQYIKNKKTLETLADWQVKQQQQQQQQQQQNLKQHQQQQQEIQEYSLITDECVEAHLANLNSLKTIEPLSDSYDSDDGGVNKMALESTSFISSSNHKSSSSGQASPVNNNNSDYKASLMKNRFENEKMYNTQLV